MIKSITYKILCNDFSGSLIKAFCKDKIPDIRWPKYQFDITGARMRNSIAASIFWGFYEAAEIRFVEKYFQGNTDVIELGASSGIVSSHIISKLSKNKRLISIEANKTLQSAWQTNTDRHNIQHASKILLNYAIHYNADHVKFNISENTTESSIRNVGLSSSDAVIIPARKLSFLLNEFNVESYSLFCDIEGAEIEILINDEDAFTNCKYLLIELHEVMYNNKLYKIEDLNNLIIGKGFRLNDWHGNVFYFTK